MDMVNDFLDAGWTIVPGTLKVYDGYAVIVEKDDQPKEKNEIH